MKQTWKKVVSLMLAVMCVFALTACGNKTEDSYRTITEDMAASCEQVSTSVIETLAGFSQEELTSEIYWDNRDTFTRLAVREWSENTAGLGAFIGVKSVTSEINDEELQVTVKVEAEFEKNDGNLTVVFNYDSSYDQMMPGYMTISEAETFAGNMKGAGINTLMGVGTVFVVLIFLILVISLFKYVNIIGQKKPEEKKAAPAPAAAPKAAPVEENLTDDLELVAVISAAIAASENTSTDSFVVRSIKKVNRSKWQRA